MLWHICYHAHFQNPKVGWCFQFEDLVGESIRAAKGCMHGSCLSIVGRKVIEKLVLVLQLALRHHEWLVQARFHMQRGYTNTYNASSQHSKPLVLTRTHAYHRYDAISGCRYMPQHMIPHHNACYTPSIAIPYHTLWYTPYIMIQYPSSWYTS